MEAARQFLFENYCRIHQVCWESNALSRAHLLGVGRGCALVRLEKYCRNHQV